MNRGRAWCPKLLHPDQAVTKVLAVAATIPQMTVLGIAGPGDPLANPARTFEGFRQLSDKAPDIAAPVHQRPDPARACGRNRCTTSTM